MELCVFGITKPDYTDWVRKKYLNIHIDYKINNYVGKPQVCAVVVVEDGSALTSKAVEEAVAAEVGESDPRLQLTGGVR